jgi:hypothetical protein
MIIVIVHARPPFHDFGLSQTVNALRLPEPFDLQNQSDTKALIGKSIACSPAAGKVLPNARKYFREGNSVG